MSFWIWQHFSSQFHVSLWVPQRLYRAHRIGTYTVRVTPWISKVSDFTILLTMARVLAESQTGFRVWLCAPGRGWILFEGVYSVAGGGSQVFWFSSFQAHGKTVLSCCLEFRHTHDTFFGWWNAFRGDLFHIKKPPGHRSHGSMLRWSLRQLGFSGEQRTPLATCTEHTGGPRNTRLLLHHCQFCFVTAAWCGLCWLIELIF